MRIHPYRTADNVIDGVVITFFDITERTKAEQARHETDRRFQILADNIPILCWMADVEGSIFWYNRRWYDYTGTSRETQVGWGWESVHDPKMLPAVKERWKNSLATGERFEMVFPIKGADDLFRPFLTRVVPLRDEKSGIICWFGTNTDITNERNTEEALRTREKHAALLMGELDHRVKNILAVVSAVIQQTLKTSVSPGEFAASMEGRIAAIARAHSLLTMKAGEGAASLREIITTELAPYDHRGSNLTIDSVGLDIGLTPKAGLAFAMAIHELASNAAKFGALSTPAGRLAVMWEINGDGANHTLNLTWTETGGPVVQPPSRRGFGSMLIERSLSHEFDAMVKRDFLAAGLRCTMKIPLTDEVGHPRSIDGAAPGEG
jgi:two-component system CheB/CheR fusion protein